MTFDEESAARDADKERSKAYFDRLDNPAPAEVWCSECAHLSATTIDGRSYCMAHAEMARRVLTARADEMAKAPSSTVRRVGEFAVRPGVLDLSLPSPESIARARRTGEPAL